jgi:hypothetical protein
MAGIGRRTPSLAAMRLQVMSSFASGSEPLSSAMFQSVDLSGREVRRPSIPESSMVAQGTCK